MSFERVLLAVRARYVLGLTATPKRRDGHHPIIEMQLGPIRFSESPKRVSKSHSFTHRVIVRHTNVAAPTDDASIQVIYNGLASNERRNDQIVGDIAAALELGRHPLVLTERREHLQLLETRLREHTADVIVLHGGLSKRQRTERFAALDANGDGDARVVLATGRFVGEGFDNPQLDTLFLALPIAWRGTLIQYAGRLHREHHAKRDVQVIDYVDSRIPMLSRMFEKRRRGYKSMGYIIDNNSASHRPLQLDLHYRPRSAIRNQKTPPAPFPNGEFDLPVIPEHELDMMIDDVLIGAFTSDEQAVAFLEVLCNELELPFLATPGTTSLHVHTLAVDDHARVIASCTSVAGGTRRIPLSKLECLRTPPLGWEWAEAYKRWKSLPDARME